MRKAIKKIAEPKGVFAKAQFDAKNNPGMIFTGYAGDGWTFRTWFCPTRKRLVSESISPNGITVY